RERTRPQRTCTARPGARGARGALTFAARGALTFTGRGTLAGFGTRGARTRAGPDTRGAGSWRCGRTLAMRRAPTAACAKSALSGETSARSIAARARAKVPSRPAPANVERTAVGARLAPSLLGAVMSELSIAVRATVQARSSP